MKPLIRALLFSAILSTNLAEADESTPGMRVNQWGQVVVARATEEGMQQFANAENKEKLKFLFDKAATQEDFDTVLKKFPWITSVSTEMWNPNIANVEAVANLGNLEVLNLMSLKKSEQTPVDLRPLAKLTKLTHLDLYATHVSHLDALNGLVNMENLNLYMSTADSIDFLVNMPGLKALSLHGTGHSFKNYAPLSSLSKLEKLSLYMNAQANDQNLQALLPLTALKKVNVSFTNGVTTLDFLKNSTGLEELTVWDSKDLVDISALAGAKKLKALNLNGTKVASLESLRGNQSLQTLDIANTPVKSIAPLAAASGLKIIKLQNTGIADISPLLKCPDLKRLEIGQSVPEKQVQQLKALLPQLSVQRDGS